MTTENKTEETTAIGTPIIESTEQKPNPCAEILALFNALFSEVQSLSPRKDGYASLSVSASGFEGVQTENVHVYYDSGLTFDFASIDELRKHVAAYDPEAVKRKRIESLKAELAELEAA